MIKADFMFIPIEGEHENDFSKHQTGIEITLHDGYVIRSSVRTSTLFKMAQRADRDESLDALGEKASFTVTETMKNIGGKKVPSVKNIASAATGIVDDKPIKKWSGGYRYAFNSAILRNNDRRILLIDGDVIYQSVFWGPPLFEIKKETAINGRVLGGIDAVFDPEWYNSDGCWKSSEHAYLGIEKIGNMVYVPSISGKGTSKL